MSVIITAKKFYSEFSLPDPFTDAGVTTLDKCVGDKVKAVIDFYVKWSSENKLLRFDSVRKTITNLNDLDPTSFIDDGFRVGDTFITTGVTGNTSTLTIALITDKQITTVESLINETAEDASIFGTTPITSIDFYYNLIKNSDSENYFSLVDKYTQQKYYADAITAPTGNTKYLRIGTNSYGWVTEDITDDVSINTITGQGITSDYRQQFRITQYFFNVPTFIIGQNTNLTENPQFPPDYYQDTEALKYICKVDAKFDFEDADVPHTGNYINNKALTSWFNEHENGRAPEYSLTSTIYTDIATSEVVTKLDFNKTTAVSINIYSKSGRFVDYNPIGPVAGTYVVLNYARCPQDETEYINTKTNFRKNFHFDRIYFPIDQNHRTGGENYGTDYQVITHPSVTYIDANNIQVTCLVNMADYLKTFLKSKGEEDRYYMFWVTTERRVIITPP